MKIDVLEWVFLMGLVKGAVDEVYINVGDKFGEGFKLEVRGKVVSINMSKMNSMLIFIKLWINIFTEVLVIKLVEVIMEG